MTVSVAGKTRKRSLGCRVGDVVDFSSSAGGDVAGWVWVPPGDRREIAEMPLEHSG